MRLDQNLQLRKHAAAFVVRKWTTARPKTSCDQFYLYLTLPKAINGTFHRKRHYLWLLPCVWIERQRAFKVRNSWISTTFVVWRLEAEVNFCVASRDFPLARGVLVKPRPGFPSSRNARPHLQITPWCYKIGSRYSFHMATHAFMRGNYSVEFDQQMPTSAWWKFVNHNIYTYAWVVFWSFMPFV